jgi:ribonuclease VapC
VLQKTRRHGAPAEIVARLLASFGLTVVDVTATDAQIAAELWRHGTPLSLADRLCLALGLRMDLPVVTTDAAWVGAAEGSVVALIR